MTNHSRRVPPAEVLPDTGSTLCSKILRSASAAALVMLSIQAFAATQGALPNRVKGAIDNTSRAALTGTVPPRAMHSVDLGAVSPASKLQGITITFSRSAAQQTDLAGLIAAQQMPGSPQYHQWLTPTQFGARFGISDSDLTAVQDWLQSQGFTDITVSPARERISFSGPEAAIETAFGTSLHFFRAASGSMTSSNTTEDEKTHIAPAHDITIPAALSGVILSVGNLSDYRMKPHLVKRPAAPKASFTSSQTGSYYLDPKDVANIYDIPSAYTGSGQTIAVAGESAVVSTDISNFQTAIGVTNMPTLNLIPNTGTSTIVSGEEIESDIDLEYSSTVAPQAAILFEYTGNNPNYGVFDALIYSIDYRVANIVTISYGICEPDLGQAQFNTYEAYMQQAATQGQTVIASSGDSGSSGCYDDYTAGTSQAEQLAVSYPASSDYVTALGGTEFPVSDLSSTYFQTTTANNGDLISSAKSYIPEVVWNDDNEVIAAIQAGSLSSSDFTPSSGGGGASIFATRPSWQTGTIGGTALPSSSYRLVPDISLYSSPGEMVSTTLDEGGYIFCSSDDGSEGIGYAGSCTNGLRVSAAYTQAGGLTVEGGTSFAAPIFAGMLAILNQAKGYTTGQGLLNTQLYATASTSAYSTAFHDIGAGSTNACTVSSTYCGTGPQTTSFATATGYDEATGLGSIDLNNLITAWPTSSTGAGLLATTTSLSTATLTPSIGAADAITITINGTGSTPVSGTVSITDNGTAIGTASITNGSGTYNYTPTATATGVQTLVFTYSGFPGVYASSSATTVLNVGNSNFTISAATSGATATFTITPVNGYTGTVLLSPETSSNAYFCVSGPASVKVTSASAVTATYTATSGSSGCASGAAPLHVGAIARNPAPLSPWREAPMPATLAGLILVLGLRRRSRLLRRGGALGLSLVLMLGLGLSGLGLAGCSNGASGAANASGTTTTSSGTSYNITVFAHDSADYALTGSAAATVTVSN